MLSITNARKTFNRGQSSEKVALNGLSLNLKPGDFAIVIGSNGAGKSTMLNAVSGALAIDSGSVVINGKDVTAMPVYQRARYVARVFQDPMKGTAASMTIAENMLLAELRDGSRKIKMGLTQQRLASDKERLAVLGLGLENRLDTRMDLLSGGQRQSVSLIMAAGGKPDILLLDEHTAALDPVTAERVMSATVKAVSAFQLTTLMVTHNMQHAIDYGSRIVMLDAGKVKLEIQNKHEEKLTVPDLIQKFSHQDDRLLLRN